MHPSLLSLVRIADSLEDENVLKEAAEKAWTDGNAVYTKDGILTRVQRLNEATPANRYMVRFRILRGGRSQIFTTYGVIDLYFILNNLDE